MAASSKAVLTDRGRGRLLLKQLLSARIFTKVTAQASQLQLLPKLLENPEIGLKLLEVATRLDKLTWRLDGEGEWLDFGWGEPVTRQHQLVPTKDLGVYITLVEGRCIVTDVLPGSVAGEEDKVERGDVLTRLMGSSLIGVDSTSKICRLLAKDRRQPISLTVAKAFQPETGELFPPLVPLLKRAGLQVEELQKRYFFTKRGRKRNVAPADEGFNPLEDEEDDYNGEEENEEVHGLPCLYLGSVSVGTSGDVDRLGLGIDKVTFSSSSFSSMTLTGLKKNPFSDSGVEK